MRWVYPVIIVLLILMRTQIAGSSMAFEEFCSCCSTAQPTQFRASLLRLDFLIGYGPQVFTDPEPASMSCVLPRRQDMVGSDTLNCVSLYCVQRTLTGSYFVAIRYASAFAQEYSPKVGHLLKCISRALRQNLNMFH